MRVLVLICVVVIGCVNAITDEEVRQEWENYQVQFGKSYRSPIEARKRLEVFKDNLEKIEAHNALYVQGKSTHTEGINQFTDWTEEEFMQYVNKGLLNKPVIVGDIFNESESFSNVGAVDWRTTSGIVTDVKNQGQCGSCWSFSATGAIEGQLGRRGQLIPLSEQNLIDCSASYGNKGCNGGLMTAAFNYVRDHGIQSEQNYPYRAIDEFCQADPSRIVARISSFVNLSSGSDSTLRQAIGSVGPISVAIDATANLQRYRGGIFYDTSCSSYSLNHGVLAVGYGSDNGQSYFIVKNSWGFSWGEGGYFRLSTSRNNPCGISSMASYPVL
ncbi:procathepsin L-like isoform X1 [Harmonia axyridis]|uniref:procathepsin L-like isoform X1 n=1 Tax=Harmonia axyridis TaxID=115357 RepID=UPI001E276BFA|nr:procathepsin L-like isoform X1 [Harmonia axyridis]